MIEAARILHDRPVASHLAGVAVSSLETPSPKGRARHGHASDSQATHQHALGGGGRRTIREEAPLAIRIRVPEAFDGERLDIAIARLADGVSRRAARRLIDQGSVYLDGQRTRVLSRRVHAGAEIRWERLAAFKPSGMPTELPRQASAGTLLEAVRDALRARGEAVPFLAAAHRLDVETSGVVVFAREREAAAGLGISEDVALGNADRYALVPRKER